MSLSIEASQKAAEALIEYVKTLEKQNNENDESSKTSKKTQLLTDYADEEHTIPLQFIDLVLTTKKFVTDKKSMTPVQVPISNAFLGKASSDAVPLSVCVLARDVSDVSDSAEFYNKALVEATADEDDALKALEAEQAKLPKKEAAKPNKKKGKKSTTTTEESIPLEELAKIRIDKVVTFTQLRNEYKPFQARRQLISEHDIFFVDSALADAEEGLLLPKILGKTFYNASKTVPQPIQLTTSSNNDASKEKFVQLAIRNKKGGDDKKSSKGKKNGNSSDIKTREAALVEAVDADKIQTSFSLTNALTGIYKRLHATHFMVSPSTQIISKIGSTALTAEQIAQNVSDFVEFVINTSGTKYVAHAWDSVRSIHLKTATGPSLPIYLSAVLYEDEAADVVADESELVKKDKKKRGISEAKLTDKRIDELLTEIADQDEIEERLAKKKPATEEAVNGDKKEAKEKDEEEEEKKEKEEKKKAKTLASAAKNGGKKTRSGKK